MKRMRMTIIVLAVCSAPAAAMGAEDVASARKADRPQSLDAQLMDDLDEDLLDGLDAIGPKKAAQSIDDNHGASSEVDRQLLRQLEAGEDVGREPSDPLLAISRRMRTVEAMIAGRDTAEPTQRLQEEIIDDLAKLIEQAQKQCSGGQCKSGACQKPGGKQAAKGGTGENRGSSRAAKNSVAQTGTPVDGQTRLERMRRMLKEVWGHLPPRIRDQLQSSAPEEFLPKYEKLIEQYYQRLAEQDSRW